MKKVALTGVKEGRRIGGGGKEMRVKGKRKMRNFIQKRVLLARLRAASLALFEGLRCWPASLTEFASGFCTWVALESPLVA